MSFAGVYREWLFDQHVLPGLECRDCIGSVERVRSGYIDDVYFWIRKKRFVAAVSLGNSKLCRKAIGGLMSSGAHCRDFMSHSQQISREQTGNQPGRENSPAQVVGHALPSRLKWCRQPSQRQ